MIFLSSKEILPHRTYKIVVAIIELLSLLQPFAHHVCACNNIITSHFDIEAKTTHKQLRMNDNSRNDVIMHSILVQKHDIRLVSVVDDAPNFY
jgi:hypothetical protein